MEGVWLAPRLPGSTPGSWCQPVVIDVFFDSPQFLPSSWLGHEGRTRPLGKSFICFTVSSTRPARICVVSCSLRSPMNSLDGWSPRRYAVQLTQFDWGLFMLRVLAALVAICVAPQPRHKSTVGRLTIEKICSPTTTFWLRPVCRPAEWRPVLWNDL
jgi:hypothetical protein